MKPTTFPQQTATINEGKDNAIPLHFDPVHGLVTCCYQVEPEELEMMKENGGKVFVSMIFPNGAPFPIISMTPELQFREMNQEEQKDFKQKQVIERRKKRGKRNKGKNKLSIVR